MSYAFNPLTGNLDRVGLGDGGGGGDPSTDIFLVKLTITSPQIKNLATTPITLVGSPPINSMLIFLHAIAFYNYGGTSVFTNTQQLTVGYAGVTSFSFGPILNAAILSNTINQLSIISTASIVGDGIPTSSIIGKSIVVRNLQTEITGNAENNNSITVYAYYTVLEIT